MTITVSWYDDDQTIIHTHYAGKWTWQEFYISSRQVIDLAKSVTHPVYILSYMDAESPVPPGDSIGIFKQGVAMLPNNVVLIVACNTQTHAVTRAIGNAVIKLSKLGNRMVFASSLEGGLDLISRNKQTAGS